MKVSKNMGRAGSGPPSMFGAPDGNRAARRACEARQRREAKWAATTREQVDQMARSEERALCAPLLRQCLAVAVPMWIDRYIGTSFEQRQERARDLARVATSQHGAMLADKDLPGETGQRSEAFNALAEALAIGAFQPDGSRFGGLHWRHSGG